MEVKNCAGGDNGDKKFQAPAERLEKLKILSSLAKIIVYNGNYNAAMDYIKSIIEP
ncbi:MAG: hypothetical protein PHX02_06700 [Oscillospiraceae bacterium]|nr:hypothetical protein [Oscillospiraceae bacterium]